MIRRVLSKIVLFLISAGAWVFIIGSIFGLLSEIWHGASASSTFYLLNLNGVHPWWLTYKGFGGWIVAVIELILVVSAGITFSRRAYLRRTGLAILLIWCGLLLSGVLWTAWRLQGYIPYFYSAVLIVTMVFISLCMLDLTFWLWNEKVLRPEREARISKGKFFTLWVIPISAVLFFGSVGSALSTLFQRNWIIPNEDRLNEVKESAHFVYHFSQGDAVDPAWQETYYGWLIDRLGITPAKKVRFYKYRDCEHLRRMTGKEIDGFAGDYEVYTIWPADNHEVVHAIVTVHFGRPPALFTEGIANAYSTDPSLGDLVSRWAMRDVHVLSKKYQQSGRIPPVEDLLETGRFFQYDTEITYPLSGSFVRFLIDSYGLEPLKKFFKDSRHLDPKAKTQNRFLAAYGFSVDEAWSRWLEILKGVNIPEKEQIVNRIQQKTNFALRVVGTIPANGAQDVDPALAEIIVTFSEPLNGTNWAWCQENAQTYPKTTGQPYFLVNSTKAVLPVKLEPDKDYIVWINMQEYEGFKNKSGVPVEPYRLFFKTNGEK